MSSTLGYTLLDNKESPSIHHNPTIKSKLNKLLQNKTMKKPSGKRITPEMVQSINDDMTGKKNEETYEIKDDDEEDDFRSIQHESQQTNPVRDKIPSSTPSRNMISMHTSPTIHGSGSGTHTNVPSAVPNRYNDQSSYYDQYQESSPDNAFSQYANSVKGNPSSSMYTSTRMNELKSPFPQNELLTKLNYMIHMLEEQQEQKTNSVVEELILYCFLGVFIIFMIDSFAKVGKYTR